MARILFLLTLLLVGGPCLTGCKRSDGSDAAAARVAYQPLPADLADRFSGKKAHAHVAELTAIGPRPPASASYEQGLEYLETTFAAFGWTTERQTFSAATPDGPVRFTNLLARHSTAPARPESLPVIVGGHFDTKKLPFHFVGANDSGSSTGVILELARVLATDPASAAKFELVLFDGEEAFRPNITPSDGLYGSKYFARSLAARPSWPALGIVLDIVGDPDYALLYNPELPERYARLLPGIAAKLPFENPLKRAQFPIIDDHVPLQNTGLPCLLLIGDFSSMDYWHQPGDTLDKISPAMLENVGRLTLGFLADLRVEKGG